MVLLPPDKEGRAGLTGGITLTILSNTMSYAVITTKIDPQDKKEAKQIAEELGLSLSAVVKVLLKQFVRKKTITLSTEEEIPNAYFKRTIAKARKNFREGKGSPVFNTGEEAVKWLEEQGREYESKARSRSPRKAKKA
jgi:addiction module RelB/DinJ family antitoxin